MGRKRKPGGGRRPSKPDYDPKVTLQRQMEAAVSLYGVDDHPSLQLIADTLSASSDSISINPIKVHKLLITAGMYESSIAEKVQEIFKSYINSGLSHKEDITETMKDLNLSKASVTSYLPYEKGVYFPQETDSANLRVGAERVRRMRKRKKVLEELGIERSEEALWAAVIEFQGYKFRTYSGLPFSYKLKKGRGGAYTKELFIDRRENSKSLAWSSVLLAFGKIYEVGAVVNRPKALGDIRGVTYIYGMFYRFGLIDVPENVKEKMERKKV